MIPIDCLIVSSLLPNLSDLYWTTYIIYIPGVAQAWRRNEPVHQHASRVTQEAKDKSRQAVQTIV